ncbi:hypothetical protein ACFU44_00790 [Nocardia rhizosphaerihabitans]|uniref:hypothetical protein n=1 Tax=Nocardia rhizosphaerihabitans TaxID=1691570 RepID=UPI00366E50EC
MGESIIKASNGKEFRSVYEMNGGELTIMTKDTSCYKSAHRSFALTKFKKQIVKIADFLSEPTPGVFTRITVWQAA